MFVSRHSRRFGAAPALALAVIAVLLAAGCGGSSSTMAAHIRFINAVPNGGAATLDAGGTFYGNENFEGVSDEHALATDTTSFSYFLAASPGTTYTATATLSAGVYYTAISMGLSGVLSTDSRYPQLQVVADSQTPPPTGDIAVRVVNASPDLTSVTVTANGSTLASAAVYPTIGSYIDIASGSLTVTAASSSNATLASATYNGIVAGHRYTLLVVETNPTALTYALELIDDTSDTVVS